ncbi:RecQ family ATP-dependent DNA helicase [Lapidilactobacillus bayanensis]|uniref:RecQ family ATP-dependent DNA helicase n=1 Tax=Lapidilactobacillus bayanensis TaxID=2485998 RepID=UPI000F770FC2|nr:RecQ family ATP-dependent DNA helicase [Lapidilactobacillus bayanensis]
MTDLNSTTIKLQTELHERFNFQQFRPGQQELLQAILAGQNALGVLPTGSGKSLIYQFLAPHLNGLFVIVSPLISLMSDQLARIQAAHLGKAAVLNSRLNVQDRRNILTHLVDYKFLFMAPETLCQPQVLRYLQNITIGLFVVDEAHCISSWGPDFRPDYLRLGQVQQQLQPQVTLALTATATDQVCADIVQQLFAQQSVFIYRASVDRPNLYLRTEFVSSDEEKWQRLQLLLEQRWPTLIYVATRKTAEELALKIAETTKRQVAFYHAGLDNLARQQVQQLFMTDQLDVVVATSAFGMGINKDNVCLLVHYDMPENFENYLQEIGRAGRDEQQALTLIFVSQNDYQRLQTRRQLNQIRPQTVTHFYEQILDETLQNSSGQLAVLKAYQRANFSEADVIATLTKTQEVRELQLQQFWQFLNSTTCLRQQVCDYFDHEPKVIQHDALCCSTSQTQSLSVLLQRLNLPTLVAATTPTVNLLTPTQVWTQLFVNLPDKSSS